MSAAQLAQQAAWMQKDLAAVDRSKTPFLVAFAHKSFQMDQTTSSLFDILSQFNVDILFVGHWHQYTRFPPMDTRNGKVVIEPGVLSPDNSTVTNAQFPTIIVTGAPGNGEVNPRTCNEPYQVNCSGNYGYGHFTVFNATHAHWTWDTIVPVSGSPDPTFTDSTWFVKTA